MIEIYVFRVVFTNPFGFSIYYCIHNFPHNVIKCPDAQKKKSSKQG